MPVASVATLRDKVGERGIGGGGESQPVAAPREQMFDLQARPVDVPEVADGAVLAAGYRRDDVLDTAGPDLGELLAMRTESSR